MATVIVGSKLHTIHNKINYNIYKMVMAIIISLKTSAGTNVFQKIQIELSKWVLCEVIITSNSNSKPNELFWYYIIDFTLYLN